MEGNNTYTIGLPRLTWEQWQVKYRPHIRTRIVWDRLQKPTPKIRRQWIFEGESFGLTLYYPWYGKKSWRDGERERVKYMSLTDTIVVAPAVLFDNGWMAMLLDGCHRIQQLRPRLIVLDCLDLHPKQLVYFDDLCLEK